MKKIFLGLFLLCFSFDQALAISLSRPIGTENRIKVINYLPNSVIKFLGHYNYHSIIEFALDEEIKTITMGDSTAWQINPAGNRIFLKPIALDATTNMTVITNRRTYFFEIHASYAEGIDDPNLSFITKFIYPEANPTLPGNNLANSSGLDLTKPSQYNFKYKISGKGSNIEPLLVFDDGKFTYFKFKNINADLPSIFIVDQNLNEALINYRITEGYLVVERVTGKFTLRQGKEVICVFNEKKEKVIALPSFIKNSNPNSQNLQPIL
jgi:type IV secretion system protein VirB9